MAVTTDGSARRRTVPAVLVAAALLGLTACTGPAATISPTSTLTSAATTTIPTPTPTPTPTDPKDINIEAAKAAFQNWAQVSDQVAQDGFADWETKILNLTGGDFRAEQQSLLSQEEQFGERQTGSTVIKSLTVTDYQEDPSGAGYHQVVLESCADTSGMDLLLPNGQSVLAAGTRGSFYFTATMQHQTNGDWVIVKGSTDWGQRPC